MADNNLTAPDPYQSTGTTPGVSATNTTAAAVSNPYSSTPLPQQNIPVQTYVDRSSDPSIPVGPDLYAQDFAQIPAIYSKANVYLTQVQENVTQHTTVIQGGDYGNANVSAYLAVNTGNISAEYFLGDGSQLTGISALGNFIVNGSSKVDVVTPGGNVVVGADGEPWTFGTDGNLTLPGNTILQKAGGIEFPASEFEWDLHSSDGNIYIGALPGSMAYIDTYSPDISIRLRTTGTDQNDWLFDSNGNLTLPDIASPSINYANGQPYGGSSAAAGNAGDIQLNVAGNIGADSTLRYVDNGGEMTLYADYLNAPGIFTSDISAGDGTPSNLTLTTSYGNATWTFGLDGYLTMPLVTKLNSGGIGNTNSAEFGTEVTSNGTAITGSQIYMGAGTTEVRGIVDSAGAGLMYAGVEGEGFAGIVGMDPGVTSSYAITVGTGNTILLGATQPGGTLTTTEYTAGVGALNANGTINGLLASSSNVVISNGNTAGWSFGAGSKITLPNGASLNDTSGDSVAFGQNAGLTSQDQHAVAIGRDAGSLYQGEDSIAIGYQAGYHDQQRGVAIGYQAGVGGTLYRSVSDAQGGSGPVHNYVSGDGNPILTLDSVVDVNANDKIFGNNIPAGAYVVSINDPDINISAPPTAALTAGDAITFVGVVIGINDASNIVYPMRVTGTNIPTNTFVQSTGCSVVTLSQYPTAPLINGAGLLFNIGQGAYSTAVGYRAGETFQADGAVAIGYVAGYQNQSTKAVAVGQFAGYQNQSANAVAVGTNAGEFTQSINAVAVGYKAGYYQQGARAVAIGEDAGFNSQGEDAVAVGQKAGFASQGQMAIAIGNTAGYSGQTQEAVAIGYGTGLVSQQYAAVAIGANAASYNQGSSAVAVGRLAGNTSQGSSAVAVGDSAGYNYQSGSAVAVGVQSGYNYQSQYAVAIGSAAGQGQGYSAVYQSGTGTAITITPNAYIQIGQRITGLYVPADTYVADIDGASLTLSQAIIGTPAVDTVWTAWGQQGISAVAIGQNAALDFQGNNAVAIGTDSGSSNQSANAVAIGYRAGYESQGANSIAIGSFAGQNAQGNNSIILNATGANLNQTTANTFTVAPIRASTLNNYSADTGNVLYYNTSTHEITTAPPNNIAGDPFAAYASNTSNVTVWTASSDQVVGAKMTVRVVYYNYDTSNFQNTEMLDIMIAKNYPDGTPAFTVSNRVKTNPAYQNVPIDVTLTGGNIMQVISSAPDGVGNNVYWTYSVTSFNQTFD